MREHSVYCFTCQCGTPLQCETKEAVCHNCKAHILIVWPWQGDVQYPTEKQEGKRAA